MAAEVREQIMALLAIEPQTPSILRQLEFLERDLARLEAPPAPAPGNYLHPVNAAAGVSGGSLIYIYIGTPRDPG